MSSEPPFQLVDSGLAREKAQLLYERVSQSLLPLLPSDVDIRHIGSTAVSGCLTKGDLDIVIRVPGKAFQQADALLARHFARNLGSIRTANFSAFEDASTDPHLGIQLTIIGGPHDVFHLFVEALRSSPDLVSDYNSLKLQHEGSDMTVYRAAKDAFVERVLTETRAKR